MSISYSHFYMDRDSVPVTKLAEVTEFDWGDEVTVGGAHPVENITM